MNCRDPERARRGAAPESKKVTLEPARSEHTNRFMKDEGKGRAKTKKKRGKRNGGEALWRNTVGILYTVNGKQL